MRDSGHKENVIWSQARKTRLPACGVM